MATLKELRSRIDGVQNIEQITRAMKMVASARLKRSEKAIVSMRPYASYLDELCAGFLLEAMGAEHPFFEVREPESYALLVLTGDRGLCGSYNDKVVRKATDIMDDRAGQDCELFVVGQRGIMDMRRLGYEMREHYSDVFNPVKFTFAESLVEEFADLFLDRQVDEVEVVYTEFFNPVRQQVKTRTLLPSDVEKFQENAVVREAESQPKGVRPLPEEFENRDEDVYIYEPDYETICTELLSRNLTVQLYRSMLEAQASEQGARMVAMDNATENAEEMIEDLTLQMNRQRQENITREILDVVGGAQAFEE